MSEVLPEVSREGAIGDYVSTPSLSQFTRKAPSPPPAHDTRDTLVSTVGSDLALGVIPVAQNVPREGFTGENDLMSFMDCPIKEAQNF